MPDEWGGGPVLRLLTGNGEANAFLISRDGLAATCAHNVAGPLRLWVETDTEEAWPARVVAQDPARDLALIQVETTARTPFLKLAGSLPDAGDSVTILAFEPDTARVSDHTWHGWLDVNQPFRVPGSVAAVFSTSDGQVLGVAGSDTPRPGYSGAPVLSSWPERVVGVHSAGGTITGVTLAISAESLKDLLQRRNDSAFRPERTIETLPPMDRQTRIRYGLWARYARIGDYRHYDGDEEGQKFYLDAMEPAAEEGGALPGAFWAFLGRLRKGAGDVPGAIAAWQEAIRLGSPVIAVYGAAVWAGENAEVRGELRPLADETWDSVKDLEDRLGRRTRADCAKEVSAMLAWDGDVDGGLAVLDIVEPGDAPESDYREIQMRRGNLLLRLDRPSEARDAYYAAGDAVPEVRLAEAHVRTGDEEGLRAAVRMAFAHGSCTAWGALAAERLGEPQLAEWFGAVARAGDAAPAEPMLGPPT